MEPQTIEQIVTKLTARTWMDCEPLTWHEATTILRHRHEVDDDDMVVEAIQDIVRHIGRHCKWDAAGMHDWVEAGDWTDFVTPRGVACQWDALQEMYASDEYLFGRDV